MPDLPAGDLPVDPVASDRGGSRSAVPPTGHPVAMAAVVRDRWDVLLVIAAGGVVGSLARWGVDVALPTSPGGFPWSTFLVNVSGAFVLGLLMFYVVEVWRPSRYVRPFLGVGVLGGFTTFSTYMVQTRDLMATGHAVTGGLYLLGTLLVGLPAAFAGLATGRALGGGRGTT